MYRVSATKMYTGSRMPPRSVKVHGTSISFSTRCFCDGSSSIPSSSSSIPSSNNNKLITCETRKNLVTVEASSSMKFVEVQQTLSYSPLGQVRYLSTATNTPDAPDSAKSTTKDNDDNNENKKKKKKKDDSNVFLDNLGTIFLAVIAMIIATLVRGSYNTSNRNHVRDQIEDRSALDPMEIDELRIANSELTSEVFHNIVAEVKGQFPSGQCTYSDFIKTVRTVMARMKGPAFTVELGYSLDRVVVQMLQKHKKSSEDEQPVTLWLTVLTLALNSSVPDRIRALYGALQAEQEGRGDENGGEDSVTFGSMLRMVGYLQDTCQLPADTQVIPTETKYPTQQWTIGTPNDLVPWEGTDSDVIDVDAFASVLRSRSVCAWGECYHKKEFKSVDG